MDIEQALLDPTGTFGAPANVVKEPALNREQKIKILRRWAYDARELEVAEEENMGGGPRNLLAQVLAALHELGADLDPDQRSATKQGGE